jgi:hypothetical protein
MWHSRFVRIVVRAAPAALLALALAACGEKETPPASDVILRLTTAVVPRDASCLQVTVVGGDRQVVRTLPMLPGSTLVAKLDGLPTGLVTVRLLAFPVICSSLTPAVEATWVSDVLSLTLVRGRPADLVVSVRARSTTTSCAQVVPTAAPRMCPWTLAMTRAWLAVEVVVRTRRVALAGASLRMAEMTRARCQVAEVSEVRRGQEERLEVSRAAEETVMRGRRERRLAAWEEVLQLARAVAPAAPLLRAAGARRPTPLLRRSELARSPTGSSMRRAADSAADSSGNNNSARQSTGALQWAVGKHGGALKLSGGASLDAARSDSIDSPARTSRITVAAWVYPTSIDATSVAFIVSRQEGTTGYEVFGLSLWNGAPAFDLHFQVARSAMVVAANGWVHIAGVYDGAFIRIYVNGNEAGTNDEVLTIPSDLNPVVIGANVNAASGAERSGFFEGYIDDLRIYDHALTAAEIHALAN